MAKKSSLADLLAEQGFAPAIVKLGRAKTVKSTDFVRVSQNDKGVRFTFGPDAQNHFGEYVSVFANDTSHVVVFVPADISGPNTAVLRKDINKPHPVSFTVAQLGISSEYLNKHEYQLEWLEQYGQIILTDAPAEERKTKTKEPEEALA